MKTKIAILLIGLCAFAAKAQLPSPQTASANLGWIASTSPGVTNYYLFWSTLGTNSWTTNQMVSVGNVTNGVVPTLPIGQTYYFTATAKDTNGNTSAYAVPCSGAVNALAAPGGTMTLYWTRP